MEQLEQTQYGLRYPNGNIEWADNEHKVQLVGEVAQMFDLEHPGTELEALLTARATAAHMDAEVYLGMHMIVTRTFQTIVTAPTDFAPLGVSS